MGICKVNNCYRECEVVRTGENFPNNSFNNNKGKIFLNNGKSLINNNQIILAKKYFELIEKILLILLMIVKLIIYMKYL